MAKLIILCGIPGCTKSTWAKIFLSGNFHYALHSSDAIRKELTGDENRQDVNEEVFNLFHSRIAESLAHGFDTVADSTALDIRARHKLMEVADGHDVHMVLFRNNAEALHRNRERERVVPENVMGRMLDKYEKTLLSLRDGERLLYDSITEISGVQVDGPFR